MTVFSISLKYKCCTNGEFFKFYILGTIQANYIHYKMINIFLCYNGLPAPSLGLIWIRGIESSGFSVIVDKHGESEAEISFCLPSLCWS